MRPEKKEDKRPALRRTMKEEKNKGGRTDLENFSCLVRLVPFSRDIT